MKTDKIKVNKTADSPDGVEVELVQPENDMEGRLLSFLLGSLLREAKKLDRIPYEIPDGFQLQHRGEGTFVVMASEPGPFYQPPMPIAIVGIRTMENKGFDLIHADIREQVKKAAQAAKDQKAATAPAEAKKD